MPNVVVYVVTNWQNLPSQSSPIDATNLNHLETGVKNLNTFINNLNTNNGTYMVLCQTPFLNADRTKLDGIEAQANKYVLPTASPSTLGGVKIDDETIKITNGVIRALGGRVSTLIDVQLVDLADGQILKYDAEAEKWVNAEVSTKISELEDVDLTDLEDGDILKWDETEEKWVPAENGEVLSYQETIEVLGEPGEPLEPIYQPSIYSFEERRVGTWVDGKPLYQKSFNIGALPDNSNKRIPHNIENIDHIFIAGGMYENGDSLTIGWTNQTNLPNSSLTDQWLTAVTKTYIEVQTFSNRTNYNYCIVHLQYTKTTDQGNNP